ncbi:MAG: AAA family ATPase [Ruminobacter sp.]|uniref:AAA family ATPase n=1 Tax=Ruminobacter sp. TaxID=2774296 RepID=UPI001B53EF70|nr:AAA family ATPase [Ruminobacter sp.]MBP3747968.1 AAA family ATPase [Ruminobacter sp.]
MLVRFTVENYLSFNERQVFSMAAGKHTRLKNHLVVVNGKRLLKGGVLFGANAAGKSNLIKAINFGKNTIFYGVSAGRTFHGNFRIDPESLSRPGVFQYDFVSNGHFYSYGLAISYLDNSIISEWLYLVDDKEKAIFERDQQKVSTDIIFSNEDNKQRFDIYAEDVPDNKTFLYDIVSRKLDDVEDFKCFYDAINWFQSLIIIFPQTKYRGYNQYSVNDTLESVAKLMNYFDTGIEMIEGQERDIDKALEAVAFLSEDVKNSIINNIEELLKDKKDDEKFSINVDVAGRKLSFSKVDGKIVARQLMMNHGNENDLFEISDESDGTQRLFDLIPLYKKATKNYVILVDELDRSFHSKLTIEFIQKFFEKTQGANTQLIVTLHDANVLNLNLLRQDEIWFVERRADHSSELYSLNKFKERFDHSVAKDYLLGRYGAVPNFGLDPWDEEEEG